MTGVQSDKLEVMIRTVRKRPKQISKSDSYPGQAGGVVYIPKKFVGHQVLVIPTSRSLRVYRLLQAVFGRKIVKI